MRRALVIGGLVLALIAGAAQAAPDPAADARYAAVLATAKAQDPSEVDWQALRFAYADSAAFDLMGSKTEAARHAMFQALNAKDPKTAIAQANLVLAQNFADIDAHVVLDLADEASGASILAKREHDTVLGILRSIRTGDGSSPEQAFTVISVQEEYQVMRAFAMTVKSQALQASDGHHYDRLDVVDADGAAHTFYFLVDRVLASEAALLAH